MGEGRGVKEGTGESGSEGPRMQGWGAWTILCVAWEGPQPLLQLE